jgi:hypothetical protein
MRRSGEVDNPVYQQSWLQSCSWTLLHRLFDPWPLESAFASHPRCGIFERNRLLHGV